MASLPVCTAEAGVLFDCLLRQPVTNWECDDDGFAAIRDPFCDREQALFVGWLAARVEVEEVLHLVDAARPAVEGYEGKNLRAAVMQASFSARFERDSVPLILDGYLLDTIAASVQPDKNATLRKGVWFSPAHIHGIKNMSKFSRQLLSLAFALVVCRFATPTNAYAQAAASPPDPASVSPSVRTPTTVEQQGSVPRASDRPVVPPLTKEQEDAFVNLVGDPYPAVALRLRSSPDLLPLAAEAADARIHRLGKGKVMSTIGLVGFVVGAALLIWGAVEWSKVDTAYTSAETDRFVGTQYILLMEIGGLLAGGGVVVGTIGLVNLASPSDAEERALARYAPGSGDRPRTYLTPYSSEGKIGLPPRAFGIRLLAFTF